MPEEKTVNTTWRELGEGVERPSGAVHELVAPRAPALVYNLEALPFAADGAVMLPVAPGLAFAPAAAARASGPAGAGPSTAPAAGAPSGSAPGGGAGGAPSAAPGAAGDDSAALPEQPSTGLLLLRQLFAGVSAVAGKKCLVAAHTDLVSGAPALALTARRAQNVALYLQGDRDAWAESCMPCEDVEWQTLLQWAAMRFGFPCDPGPIADPLRAQARGALRRFRLRFNRDFGGDLPELGDISSADFGAFYDLYDAWLERLLGGEPLAPKRAQLQFLDPAAIGCGAGFPRAPARAAGFQPPQDRRVELLFFEGDEPNLEMTPTGVHIYALREFSLGRLELEPADCVVFEVAFSEGVVDALPEGATLELSGPPGPPQKRVLADGQRNSGSMHYGFDWIDPGVAVTLKAKSGAREVVLFEDQVKGDPEQEIDFGDALESLLGDEVIGDDAQPDPVFAGRLPDFPGSPEADQDGPLFELRLHDEDSRPMANTFFRLRGGATPSAGKSKADGFIRLLLPRACPEKIGLEWGSDTPEGPFRFARDLFVSCEGSGPATDKARLHNLAYDVDGDFAAAVRAFQRDYGVDHEPEPAGLENGALPAATSQRLAEIFEARDCDATPGDASA